MNEMLILRNDLVKLSGELGSGKEQLAENCSAASNSSASLAVEGQEAQLPCSVADRQRVLPVSATWRAAGGFAAGAAPQLFQISADLSPTHLCCCRNKFITATVVLLTLLNQQPQWFPRSSSSACLCSFCTASCLPLQLSLPLSLCTLLNKNQCRSHEAVRKLLSLQPQAQTANPASRS